MEEDRKVFEEIQAFMNLSIPILELPEEVEVSTQLIPLEEEPDIHDAPTILDPKHSKASGDDNQPSQKEEKKNIRPHEKKIDRKKARKDKRRK